MYELDEITMPTEMEKNKSIQNILDGGMPKKQSLYSALVELLKSVPFADLFFGMGDCIFLCTLASGLLWLTLFVPFEGAANRLYALIFFASPFLYAALHLLTACKEIMNGTYEQMMVCRVNLRRITVLRMLVLGGVSVVIITIASVCVAAFWANELSVFRLLGMAFSALFFYAALSLLTEWKWKAPHAHFIMPLVWVGIFMTLMLLGERAERLLLHVPTALFWVITAASLLLYGRTLKHFYYDAKEGAIAHAVS